MFDFMPHPAHTFMSAPPVLCLSGPTGMRDEWIGLADCLGPRGACQSFDDASVLRRRLWAGPDGAHLVAHGTAAYHVLKMTEEIPERVRSLTLVDPDIIQALPELAACPQFFGHLSLIRRVREALPLGRLEAAAARVTEWWMGRGTWATTSYAIKERVAEAMPALAREWRIQEDAPLTLLTLVNLSCPVRIIAGRRTPSSIRSLVRLLRVAVPEVSVTFVKGARGACHLTDPHVVGPEISNFIVSSDADWHTQASLLAAA